VKTRIRASSRIPFGYQEHPENRSLLIEKQEEIEALNYVREIQENSSIRKSIKIIEERTGKKLSLRGMQKILERDY
jgi:hypothetical protein